jgi:hypothetical protein
MEAIERALAADAEARAHLVDALAHIDARLDQGLEEHAKLQVETDATVQHLRATAVETKTDLAQAVEHLATVCSMLGERIEAERRERQVLVETVASLAELRSPQTARTTARLVGGSVYATPVDAIETAANEQHSCWHPVGTEKAETS